MALVLEVLGLAIVVPGKRLAEGVDLLLDAGQIVGLKGPSGSGKTTLLRTIARLIEPASGTIQLEGQTAETLGFPAFRRQVVHVGQRAALGGGLVREALARPFEFAAAGGTFDPDRAAAHLSALGLDPSILNQTAARLSAGEQQRVALARAFGLSPKVLLLDEPTSALDPDNAARVESALQKISREAGTAMLMVSHEHAQLERLCFRVLDLADYAPRSAHA